MATPSGQIAFSQVNAELGVSPTSTEVVRHEGVQVAGRQ